MTPLTVVFLQESSGAQQHEHEEVSYRKKEGKDSNLVSDIFVFLFFFKCMFLIMPINMGVDWQLAMKQSKESEQLQAAQREQLERLEKHNEEVFHPCLGHSCCAVTFEL